jgi:hypothetical protein
LREVRWAVNEDNEDEVTAQSIGDSLSEETWEEAANEEDEG